MFKEISEHWEQFRRFPVGERFERYYRCRHESKRSMTKKALLIGLGVLIMVAGLFFMAVPGPGIVIFLIGAIFIARESLFVSRLFDRLEPRAWKAAHWCRENWKNLSLPAKVLLIAAAALLGLIALCIAYKIFIE